MLRRGKKYVGCPWSGPAGFEHVGGADRNVEMLLEVPVHVAEQQIDGSRPRSASSRRTTARCSGRASTGSARRRADRDCPISTGNRRRHLPTTACLRSVIGRCRSASRPGASAAAAPRAPPCTARRSARIHWPRKKNMSSIERLPKPFQFRGSTTLRVPRGVVVPGDDVEDRARRQQRRRVVVVVVDLDPVVVVAGAVQRLADAVRIGAPSGTSACRSRACAARRS